MMGYHSLMVDGKQAAIQTACAIVMECLRKIKMLNRRGGAAAGSAADCRFPARFRPPEKRQGIKSLACLRFGY
ncbi:hypothetical protein [Neisseria leonii]|uniref:hypothetical protein n=1 Tax=Neisseria leonii TaxID=2995413 RepID=UPI00237C3416|nr:hypothetical protein [Neisseria sp. 3986]MDD9325095.1 hypothetical protein [Neisseria sp. 3986]